VTPKERLQAILDYCDAATPGPWVAPDNNMAHQVYANGTPIASFRIRKVDRRGLAEYRANAVFTAASRTDLPRVARALLLARKTLLIMSARGSAFARNTLEDVDAILEGKDECQSTIT